MKIAILKRFLKAKFCNMIFVLQDTCLPRNLMATCWVMTCTAALWLIFWVNQPCSRQSVWAYMHSGEVENLSCSRNWKVKFDLAFSVGSNPPMKSVTWELLVFATSVGPCSVGFKFQHGLFICRLLCSFIQCQDDL